MSTNASFGERLTFYSSKSMLILRIEASNKLNTVALNPFEVPMALSLLRDMPCWAAKPNNTPWQVATTNLLSGTVYVTKTLHFEVLMTEVKLVSQECLVTSHVDPLEQR